jgi:hypothetical protein
MALKNKEAQALIDLAVDEGLVVGLARGCTVTRSPWVVAGLLGGPGVRIGSLGKEREADVEIHMVSGEVSIKTELGHIFICELAPTAPIYSPWPYFPG